MVLYIIRFGFWFGFSQSGYPNCAFTRFVATGSKTLQKQSLGLRPDDPFLIAAWAADARALNWHSAVATETGD
jgi:hypothetical protein